MMAQPCCFKVITHQINGDKVSYTTVQFSINGTDILSSHHKPLHGFPECLLQRNACFSRFVLCMRNIALPHQ